MSRKKILIVLASVALVIISVVIVFVADVESDKSYVVKRGDINSGIDCMGEIRGKKATRITVPATLRDWDLRVYEYKIVDIAMEGESVKKGEFIMKLDEEKLRNNMRNKLQEKEKVDADLKNAVLDSMVRLTGFREDIENLLLDLEYERIDLEESQYQSKAEQRKIKMKYQKAEIALNKKRRDYKLEQNKLKVHISRNQNRTDELVRSIGKFQNAIRKTRIVSPASGLLMFEKDYSGKKFTKDAQVSSYMRIPLATLPDMSTVISEAFIKEIDVTKIHMDDSVRITIDALTGKEFSGKIVKIANMGEENKNFDMKVFKVKIQLDFSDPELKPGMTTNNRIILNNVEDGLVVPLEAIFSENSERYVLKKKGGSFKKQQVKIGAEGDENAEILEGLSEGDKILMNQPEELKNTEAL